jgi:hypothetical protein
MAAAAFLVGAVLIVGAAARRLPPCMVRQPFHP